MTENGKQYVAEQAWTCCSAGVATRLLEVDSPAWLLPFLRLAGGDGEQAGARVLTAPAHGQARHPGAPRTVLEEVELGDETTTGREGGAGRSLVWRTAGFVVLFRRLEGELSVLPHGHGAVLAFAGSFEGPPGLEASPNGALAGRRAAETAVRSLLGHLRAALEAPELEEMPA